MGTLNIRSTLVSLQDKAALKRFRQDVTRSLILISSEEDVKISDIQVKWEHSERVSEKTVGEVENYFWNRFYEIDFSAIYKNILRGYYDAWIGNYYLCPRDNYLEAYLGAVLDVCKRVIQYHLHNDGIEMLEKFGCESFCSEVYVDHKDFIEAYKKHHSV